MCNVRAHYIVVIVLLEYNATT
eukprot:UN10873